MILQEFKTEYPQYAHLEGDDLWDMMTNVAFSKGKVFTADPDREIIYHEPVTVILIDGSPMPVYMEDETKTVWINERGEKGLLIEKPLKKNTTSYRMDIIDFSNLPERPPYDAYAGLSPQEKIEKQLKEAYEWRNSSPYDK